MYTHVYISMCMHCIQTTQVVHTPHLPAAPSTHSYTLLDMHAPSIMHFNISCSSATSWTLVSLFLKVSAEGTQVYMRQIGCLPYVHLQVNQFANTFSDVLCTTEESRWRQTCSVPWVLLAQCLCIYKCKINALWIKFI